MERRFPAAGHGSDSCARRDSGLWARITDLEPPAYGWVCGQITVGLRPDGDALIEDVVARQGAMLTMCSTGSRTSMPTSSRWRAEPRGMTVAMHAQDPDVRYSQLNLVGGELAGPNLPDTAMASVAAMPWLVALILGPVLLGALGLMVRRTGR